MWTPSPFTSPPLTPHFSPFLLFPLGPFLPLPFFPLKVGPLNPARGTRGALKANLVHFSFKILTILRKLYQLEKSQQKHWEQGLCNGSVSVRPSVCPVDQYLPLAWARAADIIR